MFYLLHSIMYLLIHGVTRLEANSTAFTFHNVSINSGSHLPVPPQPPVFTFHNVSINSHVGL